MAEPLDVEGFGGVGVVSVGFWVAACFAGLAGELAGLGCFVDGVS